MGAQAGWDNTDCTTIFIMIEGKWSWNDIRNLRDQCVRMLNAVSHPVDIIVDQGKATWFPEGYRVSVRRILTNIPQNVGHVVIVSTNPLVKQAFHIFVGLNEGVDFRYHFAQTVEEAREILKNLRLDE